MPRASIPSLVTTTIIDGDDLGLVPTGFDVVPTPDKSVKTGTLGLTRIGWVGLGASANVVVSYDRLDDLEADLLLMLCEDLPDGRARIIQFSNQPGEARYTARRIKVNLSDGASTGTWAVRMEFNGNALPL